MMRKILFFISLLLSISFTGFSQQVKAVLKGKITDAEGRYLAGAAITINETYLGTYSGPDGQYTIWNIRPGNYSVRITFIGYEEQNRDVNIQGETVLDISMVASSFMTDEVLVNATRAGEHAPLAYSVIDKTILQKQNMAQDMPYLLSLTPSLVETSEAGNGVGYTGFRIRGTDANRINVTMDGIPLNDPESHQVFWVDLPDIASSVENIQIQRGVGTSSNGAGAFGATVSLQTLNPDNEPSAEINSSYGSFNTLKNSVSTGTGLIAGKYSFMMRYSDIRSDGYIDRTGSKHRSAFMSAVYRTEKSRLRANVILGEEHTGLGWWGVPSDSLNTNRTYNPAGEYTDGDGNLRYYNNESDNYNQDHYQLIWSRSAGRNLNLNAALHYTRGKGYYEEYKDGRSLVDYGLDPFFIGGQEITETDLIQRKWLDNDFYGMIYSLDYRKNRYEFITGGGINRYDGDHYGTVIWMRNAGNSEKDYQWYFNNSLKSEFNIFGKLNYSLSEKLKAYGDVQYRFIDYNMRGQDDDLKDLGQRHKYGFFNPKAGLFYAINNNQDIWMSFSVANREPTRADFKEASGDPEATPRPETLYDTELGYKLRGNTGTFSAGLYGMFYKDQLVPTGELSNVGYPIMTNVDRSYRIGIELSSAVKLARNFLWNANLTISRNKITNFTEHYTDYISADDTTLYLSKGLGLVDIAYSPGVIFTNDLGFRLLNVLNLHFITKYVGKQYFDNTMNTERSIDPYLVNNFRADFTPGSGFLKAFYLQFNINNIFNTRYENNAYGGNWYMDGVENTWSYYFPQAGRNYMVRLGIKF